MRIKRRTFNNLAIAGAASGFAGSARAQAKPLTIGFGMALTGGLAPNGKAALLAMQIWEEDINAKGGLLGRPVKLVYYDDQSNPSTVPGLYTKLMDVDKVDIMVSGYATNMIAPAMPIVMQHDRTFFALFGLAVNSRVQLSALLLDHADRRPEAQGSRSPRASSKWRWRRIPSRRRWPWSAPTPSSRATPWKACATSPRSTTSRSSTTRPIRRRPPTTRRSCGRWRRPIPTSSSPASYPPDSVGIIRASQRDRLQAQDLRRRHGRPAGDGHQDAARAAAERHRGLRLLAAVGGLRLRRGPRLPEEVPGQVGRGRRRPAGLLPAAVRLCPDAGRRAGGEGCRRHRRRQARRVHAQDTPSRPWSATSSSTTKASGRPRR